MIKSYSYYLLLLLGATLISPVYAGGTYHWCGAENGYWTNAANWVEGQVPGRYYVPDAVNGGFTTNGLRTDIAIFGDDLTGAKATTINFDGVFSISNLLTTGTQQQYTYGASESQYVPIHAFGVFSAGETPETRVALVPGILQLGVECRDCKMTWNATLNRWDYATIYGGDMVTVRNNSSEEFVINQWGYRTLGAYTEDQINYRTNIKSSVPTFGAETGVRLEGTGNIRLTRQYSDGAMFPKFEHALTGKLTVAGRFRYRSFNVKRVTGSDDVERQIEILEGGQIEHSNGAYDGLSVNAYAPTRFYGKGRFVTDTAYHSSDKKWKSSNMTFSSPTCFDCALMGKSTDVSSSYKEVAATKMRRPGFWLSAGSGPVRFNADTANTAITGTLFWASTTANFKASATAFGKRGTNGAFGNMDLCIANGGVAQYVGPGETTDRILYITNNCISVTTDTTGTRTCSAVIEQAGTGAFYVNSRVEVPAGVTGTLTLRNNTGCAAFWNTNLTAKVNLIKDGTGAWYLSATNTYAGTTTVSAGTLYITKSGTLGNGSVMLAKDTTLIFEGDGENVLAQRAPAISVSSGTATVRVGAGCTVTFAGLTNGGGILNIVTADNTACVKFPADVGDVSSYLLLNGKVAQVTADGTVAKVTVPVTTTITVKGGVIANDATASVGITEGGESGNVTLAAADTTVKALVHQAASAGTVELRDGETLNTGTLAIDENKGDLTIGTTSGLGTLKGADSTLTLWPDSATATIAIKSTVSDVTTINKMGDGLAQILSPFTFAGNLQISFGTLEVADMAAMNATLMGPGRFIKSGNTDWTLTKAQDSFTGEFVVSGGSVKPGQADATKLFGKNSTSTLVITNGGTLYVDSDTNPSGINYGSREVHVSGHGKDGCGALVHAHAVTDNTTPFTRLTLDGDTSVTNIGFGTKITQFTARDGISAVFNMNGHSFTRRGYGRFYLPPVVTNLGPITLADVPTTSGDNFNFIVFANTKVYLPEGKTYADAPISAGLYSRIVLSSMTEPLFMPLNIRENGILQLALFTGDGLDFNRDNWSGPITLAENSTLNLYAYGDFTRHLHISGALKGPNTSTIAVPITSGHYYLLSTNNTAFLGKVQLNFPTGSGSYSDITLIHHDTLPYYTNITATGMGAIKVRVNADRTSWPDEKVGQLLREADFKDPRALYATVAFDTADLTAPYTVDAATLGDLSNTYAGIGASGSQPVVFTGALNMTNGMFECYDGTLRITGEGQRSVRQIKLGGTRYVRKGGRLEILDGAHVTTSVGSQLGPTDNTLARLYIRNATLDGTVNNLTVSAGSCSSTRAIIEVAEGGALKLRPCLGEGSGCLGGALWQSGGTTTAMGEMYVGHHATGYLEMDGGTFRQEGNYTFSLATGTSNTVGVVHLKEGTVTLAGEKCYLAAASASNSWVHVRVSGGRFEMRGSGTAQYCKAGKGMADGTAILTVDGGLYQATNHTETTFGGMIGGTGICNLNGGVCHTWNLLGGSSETYAGCAAFLNFNGGTFRCGGDAEAIRGFTRVTVRTGGAVIDTDGHDTVIAQDFAAPVGGGVVAIPLSGETLFKDADDYFIYSPAVVITGDGTGASAYAEFDHETLALTRIVVTSPGCGYTWAKATIHFGGEMVGSTAYHRIYELGACTIGAAETAGGFTKQGAGTLTLTGNNAWGGDTVVEGGLLKVGASAAVPSASKIILKGGGVAYASGVTLPETLEVSLTAEQLANRKNKFVLLECADGLPEKLPALDYKDQIPVGSWQVCRESNRLVLRYVKGTHLHFR